MIVQSLSLHSDERLAFPKKSSHIVPTRHQLPRFGHHNEAHSILEILMMLAGSGTVGVGVTWVLSKLRRKPKAVDQTNLLQEDKRGGKPDERSTL